MNGGAIHLKLKTGVESEQLLRAIDFQHPRNEFWDNCRVAMRTLTRATTRGSFVVMSYQTLEVEIDLGGKTQRMSLVPKTLPPHDPSCENIEPMRAIAWIPSKKKTHRKRKQPQVIFVQKNQD